MKKHLIIILALVLFTGLSAGLPTMGFANQAKTTDKYSNFRLSYEEMYKIASDKTLSHRIFYKEPSKGSNAKWFDAVKQGNLAEVKAMVNAGQNIEVKDEQALGQTALGWAAFIGYLDMVKYLIEERKANLYATDRADVKNAFKSAVLGDSIEVVEYLYPMFKGKIDLNEQEPDGETFVMVASSNNRIEIVKFLLNEGVDISVISKQKNQNALTFACSRGHTEMAKLLIEHGAINFKTGKASC